MTTPEIRYRSTVASDLPALAALRWEMQMEGRANAEALAPKREAFIAAFCADLDEEHLAGSFSGWLAEAGGEPVACACLTVWHTLPQVDYPDDFNDRVASTGLRGHISNIYTRPAYRGQGIARQLVRSALDYARVIDVYRLTVAPCERRTSLFERLGFTAPNRDLELSL